MDRQFLENEHQYTPGYDGNNVYDSPVYAGDPNNGAIAQTISPIDLIAVPGTWLAGEIYTGFTALNNINKGKVIIRLMQQLSVGDTSRLPPEFPTAEQRPATPITRNIDDFD